MTEKRQFRDRLLDGFDRSRIRRELTTVRRGRMRNMGRRYTTMMMGASLAVGGVGIPMSIANNAETASSAPAISTQLTKGANLLNSAVEKQATVNVEQLRQQVRDEVFKSEIPFGELILSEAKKNDLPPELVAAVVETESQFKPNAKSPVGARGLMQLMPRTGAWMGASNLSDPQQNVRAGTKYLKYLQERFDGDQTKILAAYNAGEGNVRKYGGVPPFKETRNYVKKVANSQDRFAEQIDALVDERVEQRVASVSQ